MSELRPKWWRKSKPVSVLTSKSQRSGPQVTFWPSLSEGGQGNPEPHCPQLPLHPWISQPSTSLTCPSELEEGGHVKVSSVQKTWAILVQKKQSTFLSCSPSSPYPVFPPPGPSPSPMSTRCHCGPPQRL